MPRTPSVRHIPSRQLPREFHQPRRVTSPLSSRQCLRHVYKYNKYSGTSSPPSGTRANATSILPGGQLAIPFKFGQPAFGANYDDSRSTADRDTTAGDLSDTGRDR